MRSNPCQSWCILLIDNVAILMEQLKIKVFVSRLPLLQKRTGSGELKRKPVFVSPKRNTFNHGYNILKLFPVLPNFPFLLQAKRSVIISNKDGIWVAD